MSEMVEHVARAMADKLSEQQFGSTTPWHDPEFRQNAMEVARAAIKAMREPTENMIRAGYLADTLALEDAWREMIDEALKESEPASQT